MNVRVLDRQTMTRCAVSSSGSTGTHEKEGQEHLCPRSLATGGLWGRGLLMASLHLQENQKQIPQTARPAYFGEDLKKLRAEDSAGAVGVPGPPDPGE